MSFFQPPAIQQVTQTPMKCLVSALNYSGAVRPSLAWTSLDANTQASVSGGSPWNTGESMEYRSRTALPVCRSFPQPQWALAARAAGQRPGALSTADRAGCWSPSSQPPRLYISSGTNGGTGGWVSSARQKAENWLNSEQYCPRLTGVTDNPGYPLVTLLTNIPWPPLGPSSP